MHDERLMMVVAVLLRRAKVVVQSGNHRQVPRGWGVASGSGAGAQKRQAEKSWVAGRCVVQPRRQWRGSPAAAWLAALSKQPKS